MEKSVILMLISVLTVGSIVSILWLQQRSVILSENRSIDMSYPKLRFTISLLNSLQKNDPHGNIFYSPQSVYQALLSTYLGAAGETKKELESLLGLLYWANDETDVENAYKAEKDVRANSIENKFCELFSVDKLYFSDRVSIRDSMKKLLNEKIEQLNFSDALNKRIKDINLFIETTTKNNIRNFLQPHEITQDTVLTIVNAVYFNGKWASGDSSGIFYKNGVEPVAVNMMKQTSNFTYGVIKNLDAEVLRMPYAGENERFSMYIFLPAKSPTSIDELLKKLTADILDDVLNGINMEYGLSISVTFPKFSFEKKSELIPALQRMGVQSLFDSTANLIGFTAPGNETKFEVKLVHKAKTDVNELDSTDSVDTPEDFGADANRCSSEFNCDHPFIFFVHDEKFKEILFAGIYREPYFK